MLLPLISHKLKILIGTLQPLGNQGLIRWVIPESEANLVHLGSLRFGLLTNAKLLITLESYNSKNANLKEAKLDGET